MHTNVYNTLQDFAGKENWDDEESDDDVSVCVCVCVCVFVCVTYCIDWISS